MTQYMTQEMCNEVVSKVHFILKYCLDVYKPQEMCEKAVDPYLLALKFVPDWFATSKVIRKLDNVLFSDNDIVFSDIDPSIQTVNIL